MSECRWETFPDLEVLKTALQEYFEKRKIFNIPFTIENVTGGIGFDIDFPVIDDKEAI